MIPPQEAKIIINWEMITAIATTAMTIAAFIALRSYNISKKSQYLATIENCSREYRHYMRLIQLGKFNEVTKHDLLGLFHKQLSYIENDYLPKEIKVEWLITMFKILHKDYLAQKGDCQIMPLVFDKSDWENSFERVSFFMDLKPEKGNDFSDLYLEEYLNKRERRKMRKEKFWQKSFIKI